ncbi:MAG: sensor histidine kinase [Bacteroidota bacterium]|nr:sensor histidine kinase [Bacteroidota bacterium]
MQTNGWLSWRIWPLLAGTLSTVFIIYGLSLVSRSHRLQERIADEVSLLDELNQIERAIENLMAIHKEDIESGFYQWPGQLQELRSHIAIIGEKHSEVPGMDDFVMDIDQVLQRSDSIHREAMAQAGSGRPNDLDAILRIILRGSHKIIDHTASTVHEQGLLVHTGILSDRWTEAELVVITACLLAVVFAWLVGMSNRLLQASRQHGEQLIIAKKELERSNKELRDTMLSKEEKEMMIKEIHHRVKNNLQIVKSLIRFQMDQVKDPKVSELFNECVNRVSAMALVHEQTYLSKDLANIDVNTYLSHLTRDLCQAYTIDTRLQLDIQINVPTLGVDTLIPLGLLINEIISNSLKYAFKGRPDGLIIVHLNGDQEGGLYLRIGDNGIGLPDRKQWRDPKSLGMELIHTLTEQLDSSIELADGPGTVYELTSLRAKQQKRA